MKGQELSYQNTPAMSFALDFVVLTMLKYLNDGFYNNLYQLHEMKYVFGYLKHLYTIGMNNRRIMMHTFCGDLIKKNMINFDEQGNTPFKRRRKKFTPM